MKYCPKCKASYPLSQRFCSTDGASLTLQDPYNLVGRTLVDKYRLDALVGMGGMGAVYCAVHVNTGRQIAVKILLPNLAIGAPRLVELFEREARVVGRLKHENIVDIIDAGRTTESIAYIAMEWLEGLTLEEEIQWNGPLSIRRVSEILRQIAAALQESHTQHILHRDLKPSNIFLVKRTPGRDQVKVMDFGISKLVGDTQGSPVSSLMGTPQYASPEQFRLGENIDSRTDIYSLGVVLFQMLTNSLPFNDTTVSALIYKHLNEPPPPLRSLRPDIPPALDELVTRMLAKQPADRPQRVGDLPDLFDRAVGANRVTVINEAPISETPPGFQNRQSSPSIQPPIQPPMRPPTQPPMRPQMQPPTRPQMQQPMQPPMRQPPMQQPPMRQPPMRPPMQQPPMQQPPMQQPPMRPPMQPPMQQPPMQQPPMRPSMQQPPLHPSIQPKTSKRRRSLWPLMIGGAVTIFFVLMIGFAVVWYLSDTAWKENMEAERRAFREGRYLEAVNYAQAALKEAEAFGPQDARLATSLHNAGELYTRLERYAEAEGLLQRALTIREKVLEDQEAARTIYALARLNHNRGNKDKAERLYRQSLAIREKVLGREHPDVAESLSGLAGALSLKRIEEAERLAKRSLSIREKALGENHPDVAESLSSLAEVILDIGKPSEVESYLRRAITIRETSLGQTHPYLAESLAQLGVFFDKRGQCRDAEAPMRRAITIFENAYGTDHPTEARCNLALAGALAGQNREFEELIGRATAIFQKSSGPESKDMARALSTRGKALTYLGRYKDAESNLLQSLAILEKSERMMGELVAEANLDLVGLYSKQGAFTKSEEYLRRSMNAFEKALGKDHPVFSALLITQAIYLARLKRIGEAEDKLRQAETGVQRASGTIRSPLQTLSSLARALLLFEKGEYDQASEKVGSLMAALEDSPLLFGDVVHFVYSVSLAQQIKPIGDGLGKMIAQVARDAGRFPAAQADNLIQRIEVLESTAKRGLILVENEQCKRNQNLMGEYKVLLGVLYTMKALLIDAKGNHQEAMAVLRDNLATIQESLKHESTKSDMAGFFTVYGNLLRSMGRYGEASEIESLVKAAPAGNAPAK
jgi:serine/threonine protein kinase/tetratricopeptide (TPR) repeat protein